jgi:hypothetical protein
MELVDRMGIAASAAFDKAKTEAYSQCLQLMDGNLSITAERRREKATTAERE